MAARPMMSGKLPNTTVPSDSEDEEQPSQSQPQNGRSQSQPQNGRSPRKRMADVNMPSGLRVSVLVPAKHCDCRGPKCEFTVRLTELRPNGSMGVREYQIVVKEMAATIKQHALQERGGGRFRSYDITTIHKIQNCCLWKRFRRCERQMHTQTGYGNQRMLFHGTNATDTIVKTGFDKSHAKPGSMFGGGIYFAEHSSKSNQYAFGYLGGRGCPTHSDKNCYICERKILLCRVALGKMYAQKNVNKMNRPPQGYNSVEGQPSNGGLRYPEFVIYNGDQAYPEYLITYKIVR